MLAKDIQRQRVKDDDGVRTHLALNPFLSKFICIACLSSITCLIGVILNSVHPSETAMMISLRDGGTANSRS